MALAGRQQGPHVSHRLARQSGFFPCFQSSKTVEQDKSTAQVPFKSLPVLCLLIPYWQMQVTWPRLAGSEREVEMLCMVWLLEELVATFPGYY